MASSFLWPLRVVLHWLWLRLPLLGRFFPAGIRRHFLSRLRLWGKAESEDSPLERVSEDQREAGTGARRPSTAHEGEEEEGRDWRGRRGGLESGDHDDEDMDGDEYRVEVTDEFYCGYDSTWEAEEGRATRTWKNEGSKHHKFNRFENAARDLHNYRNGYLNRPSHWRSQVSDDQPNLKFYLGLQPSEPDGIYIHTFHRDWAGEYETLEYVHTYIQWLFPLQEPGMNHMAVPMTAEEVKGFNQSDEAKENLLASYKLMLDFYGIVLCDELTGRVKRAPNWNDRFQNLNSHTHNNLRITRILKCLGTLGYPHYQSPLVQFFLEETLVHGQLPNVRESVLNYFLFTVLNRRERRSLIKFAYRNYKHKNEFVWCPKKIQMLWS